DPSIGVVNGLKGFAERLKISLCELLENTDLIVHGTTVTTNAVLTGRGAKTALLTTEGFRDILQMRRGVRSRKHLFDNKYISPPALVTRELRLPVSERTFKTGDVEEGINKHQNRDIEVKIQEEHIKS